MTAQPWAGRRLHIIGIAGAGMSALAVLAQGLGAEVSGSDRNESRYLDGVREAGIAVSIGHDAANLPDGDVEVVSSTAIPEDNPERAEARRRGLTDRSRHQLLNEVCGQYRVIAIAGAHGKTTTSAMTVHALQGAGEDPSYLVGGILGTTGRNVHCGTSEWLVVEADESDRSFLETNPEIAVVTSVELDHHGTYGSKADLDAVFREFLENAPQRIVWDVPELDAIVPDGADATAGAGETVRYGLTADEVAPTDEGGVRFSWDGHDVTLRQPGIHNAWNATAALAAAARAGADPEAAAAAMAIFAGTGRRFEQAGIGPHGAVIIDDYAHHPTEVARTIEAARTRGPERVVAVFQPHLYSRTQLLADEFGRALALADLVCLIDVYPARERAEDFPGISGLTLARTAADAGDGRPVVWLSSVETALRELPGLLRAGDLCLCMGAGNIDEVAHGLVAG